MVIPVISKNIY